MIDIPPPTVARAIGILRSGAMRADAFARAMWPERSADRTPGEQSRSGHALLREFGRVGYVQQVGDLWTLRTVGTADGLRDFPVPTADATAVGLGVGLPVPPADGLPVGQAYGPEDALPAGAPPGWRDQVASRQRLYRLVALATEPVPTVTHDRVLGDIEIRGVPLDPPLEEACSWVVLRGIRTNVYPIGRTEMLVGLSPIEAARALHVRWRQSGVPPVMLDDEAWFFADDGLIASPFDWKPVDVDEEEWLCGMEPVHEHIRRQRAEAGLA